MSTAPKGKKKDSVNNLGKHGWLIVLSSFLLYMMGCAIVTDLLNVSVSGICAAHPQLNSTVMLSASSIAGWITLVAALFTGGIVKKYGPRKVMTVSSAVFAVACFLLGMVTANWQYVVLVIVIGICDATSSGMAMQTVVSRWFPTKKGVVMGWATLGLGASTTLMLPFFNWLLGSIGIVKAYWVMALIAAIVCIYNYIVVRDVPEELGIAPDNNPNIDTAALASEAEQIHEYMKSSPWTIKKLLKTKELWLTAYMLGCGMLVATGIFSQFVPRMASYGVDANLAVLMLSLVCIFGVPFSYMWGVLDAKFGPKNLTTIMLCWYLVGVIVLIVSGGNIVGSAIGLCIFESALGGINNMLTSYTTTVWGRYDFQNANRLMYPIYNAVRASAFIIMAMSTALFGGNYNITYGIMAGLLVIAIICSIIMKDTLIGRSDADMKAALNIKD